MAKILEACGVALAGLITSVLTALLVALIDAQTGVNVFTFSFWVVIPVGAIGCGLVAASGYFLAAKLLHQPATKLLLVQMVLIAALSQFLIYWFEYQLLTVNGVHAADYVPFLDYLNLTLTSSHIEVHSGLDSPEVGSFGYVIAAIEFVGFLAGGAAVYFKLGDQTKCAACGKYLKTLATKKNRFGDMNDYIAYANQMYDHPVDSPEFAANMRAEHKEKGSVSQTTKLQQCPSCGQQSIFERLSLFDGKEWSEAPEYDRMTEMPQGIDVRPAFK